MDALNPLAEEYVNLCLQIGLHDPVYIDAYYGPKEWQENAVNEPVSTLQSKASDLTARIAALYPSFKDLPSDSEGLLRFQNLYKQARATVAHCRRLGGEKLTFEEQADLLYDAKPPTFTTEHFEKLSEDLSKLLEEFERKAFGSAAGAAETLSDRLERFRSNFVIATDKLDAVFGAAITECRKRTLKHIELPPGENFKVGYVTGRPWSAYNWYKGNSFSLIEVNTEFPIYIDRVIDLAAHEGYPGHHVFNGLLENGLVRERGWMEYTVYPLFNPSSLIAEGTANYGIKMAFPTTPERIAFEREVLFPLAGLDPSTAEIYYEVMSLIDSLAYCGNEAARGLINGTLTRQEAQDWLVKYQGASEGRAEQRLRFIDAYGAYAINYNLGQDLVAEHVKKHLANTDGSEDARWKIYKHLLQFPLVPSVLAGEAFTL